MIAPNLTVVGVHKASRIDRIVVRGIELNLDWSEGKGVSLTDVQAQRLVPDSPILYAVVSHRLKLLRNGETARGRGRVRHEARWMRDVHSGRGRACDYSRLRMVNPDPYVMAAVEHGPASFEFFVVSDDLRLVDKSLRQDLERALFRLVRRRMPRLESCNRQRSWH